MSYRKEITLGKRKIFLGIIGCILVTFLGIWILLFKTKTGMAYVHSFRLINNSNYTKLIGILFTTLAVMMDTLLTKKLFEKKRGLVFYSNGFLDNPDALCVGLIEWADVTHIRTIRIGFTRLLLIHVKNPEKYINQSKTKLDENLMCIQLKRYGTPISLSSSKLKCSFKNLERTVRTEYENYKIVEL